MVGILNDANQCKTRPFLSDHCMGLQLKASRNLICIIGTEYSTGCNPFGLQLSRQTAAYGCLSCMCTRTSISSPCSIQQHGLQGMCKEPLLFQVIGYLQRQAFTPRLFCVFFIWDDIEVFWRTKWCSPLLVTDIAWRMQPNKTVALTCLVVVCAMIPRWNRRNRTFNHGSVELFQSCFYHLLCERLVVL